VTKEESGEDNNNNACGEGTVLEWRETLWDIT
jgi:hypothetical protein